MISPRRGPSVMTAMIPFPVGGCGIVVTSATLPSALVNAGVNAEAYNALVIDTQGSELLVLRGSESLLPRFKYIEVEAADFESYKGGATMKQIRQFLSERGFRLARKQPFAKHRERGTYFNLLFKRRGIPSLLSL